MDNPIALRASIDEIVGLRRQALNLYEEGYKLLSQARATAKQAAPNGFLPTYPDSLNRLLETCSPERFGDYQKTMSNLLDRAVWDHVVSTMGIERLMDAQAREQFRTQLQSNPPEVTVENVRATVETLMGDAAMIFRRGIAKAFAKLDRRFRTHDAFKIGSKVIFTYAFSRYGTWSGRIDEYLRDVERTFHILDGKEQPERYAGIIGAIDEKRRVSGLEMQPFEAESDYFRVKAFKNGNLHVWFKRDDLIDKVNLLLAEYYGANLADSSEDAREAAKKGSRAMTPAKNFGFFPTPDELAERVLESAYIRPGDRVLEPSAGTGSLSSRALAAGGQVTCVEMQPHLAQQLLQNPDYTLVLCDDFLNTTPEGLGEYDKIIMNPPFDRGRDIDHVDHALDFLAPGGTLVAIMSAGVEFRSDNKGTAFRNRIERMRGNFYDLPHGSFAEVGTMVNTVLLTVSRR